MAEVEVKPILLTLDDVIRATGQSRSSIYAKIKSGEFPAPVKIGSASRWSYRELEEWAEAHIAARDAEEKAQRETDEIIAEAEATGRSVDRIYAERRVG